MSDYADRLGEIGAEMDEALALNTRLANDALDAVLDYVADVRRGIRSVDELYAYVERGDE